MASRDTSSKLSTIHFIGLSLITIQPSLQRSFASSPVSTEKRGNYRCPASSPRSRGSLAGTTKKIDKHTIWFPQFPSMCGTAIPLVRRSLIGFPRQNRGSPRLCCPVFVSPEWRLTGGKAKRVPLVSGRFYKKPFIKQYIFSHPLLPLSPPQCSDSQPRSL